MPLLKWVDIYGKTFIFNPIHVISLSIGNSGLSAYVNFVGRYYIEIPEKDIEEFTEKWYIALNKKDK